MIKKVPVRLTKKPFRSVPVGGEIMLTPAHARVVVLIGLGEYAVTPERRVRRAPKKKART